MKKVILFFLFAYTSLQCNAQTVSFDSTFATNGMHKGIITGLTAALDILVASDQKIYALYAKENSGNASVSFVARYNSNGTLDNTFGTNGLSANVTFPNEHTILYKMRQQSDGKIIAIGDSYNGMPTAQPKCIAVRFNTNGTLDNTFGTAGIANFMSTYNTTVKSPRDFSIQPDGKILVAIESSFDSSCFVRLTPSGSLDNTFGNAGIVKPEAKLGLYLNMIAALNGGGIIGGGYRNISSSGIDTTYIVLYKLTSTGTLDNSFGTGGILKIDIANKTEYAEVLKVQSDGKIVCAGDIYPTTGSSTTKQLLVRITSNGTLDNSFNSTGILEYSYLGNDGSIYDIELDSNNKITTLSVNENSNGETNLSLHKWNTNGSADLTFHNGSNNRAITEIPFAEAYALATQSDGKLLFAGIETDATFSNYTSVIGRLKTGGGSVGVKDLEQANAKLYPTICEAGASLTLENGSWARNAFLVGADGRKINLNMTQTKIRLPNYLPTGFYSLILSGKNTSQTISIIIQ